MFIHNVGSLISLATYVFSIRDVCVAHSGQEHRITLIFADPCATLDIEYIHFIVFSLVCLDFPLGLYTSAQWNRKLQELLIGIARTDDKSRYSILFS